MTVDEIDALTRKKLRPANSWWRGVLVDGMWSDLRLYLDAESSLESTQFASVDGWRVMSVKTSPRVNLCTGELFFRIRLLRTVELDGAVVTVNGVETPVPMGLLEVTQGTHEVRVEKAGYEPIIRHLKLGPEDRGDQRIDLTDVELRPLDPPS